MMENQMFSHYLTQLFSLTNGETQQGSQKMQDLEDMRY